LLAKSAGAEARCQNQPFAGRQSTSLSRNRLETRARIAAAEARQKDPASLSRILIVNGSTRSEHSCPGEISKTRRLAQAAQAAIEARAGYEVDFLDLSTLAD
jgi:hypothetical protein